MNNYDTSKMLISTFSGQERYFTVPKVYVDIVGDFNTAVLLNQIVFWSDKTKRKDGYFYKTYGDWEQELTLTEYQVRRSVKVLKDKGIVETKIKRANGSPTLHYKLNMNELSDSILKFLKNRNSTNLSFDNGVSKESLTVDDTLDDTLDDNIDSPAKAEQPIPYQEIIEYLNQTTDSNYKHTSKATQSLIKARVNEGFGLDDFKKVIDTKTSQWLKDKEMSKYLRPQTLFGTKFESYLNEKSVEQKNDTSFLDNLDELFGGG